MSPKVTKRPPGPKDHAASTRTDSRPASGKKQKEPVPSVATAFETIGKSVTAFAKDVGDTTQRLAKSARVFAHTIRTETQRPDKNIVQVIEEGFADAAQAFAPKPDFAILADEAEEYLDTIRHLAKSDPKLKPAALEMAAQYQGILGAGIATAVWDYQHDPDSRSVAQRQAMDFADAFYREVPTEESLDGVFATYAAVDRDVAKLRRAVARNAETIRTHVSKEARGAAAPLLDAADRNLPMGDVQFQKTLPAGPEAIFLQSADQSHVVARAENAILEPLLTATESRITTLVQSTHAQSPFYREAHLGMAQVHMGDPQTGVRHLESARQIFRDKGDAKPLATEIATQIEVLHRIATNSPDDAQLAKDRLSEADSMIDLLGHDKGNRDKATLFRIDNLLHTLPHRIQEHDENLKHNPDNVEAYHRAVAREHQKIIDYCSRVKSKDPAIVALAHGNGMLQASVQFEKRLDAAMSLRLMGEPEDARLAHLAAENKFTKIRGDLERTASPAFMHEAMGRMHWANATYTFKTGDVEESLRDLRTLSTTYGASGAAQILKDGSGEDWVHHYGIVDDHGNFSPDIGKPSQTAKWKKIADAALSDKASAMKAMMAGAGVAIVGAASADALFGTHVIGGEALLTMGQAGMIGAGAGLLTERGYQVLSAQREISAAYTTGIANVTTEELADRGKALAGEVAVCFLAGGAARYVRMGVTTLGAGLRAPLLRGLISESGIVAEGIAFHEFAGAIHGETDRSALGYFRSILTLRMLAAGSELNLGSLLFPGEKWADAVMRHGFNTAVSNIPLQAFESAIARDLSGFGQGYFDGLFGLYAITLGGKIPETILRAPQILAQAKAMHQERSARKLITRAETLAKTISTLQSNRDYARTPTEKIDLTQKLITAMRAHAAAYQKLASMGLYPADAAADYAEGVGAFTQFAEMAIQHQKSATPSKAKVTAQQIATRTRKLTKSTVRYGKLAVVAPALLMTGAIGGMGGGGQRRVAHSIPEHFLQIIGVGTGWSREGLNIAEQTRKNPQRAAGAILNHLINLISLAHYVDTPEPETQAMARAAMTEMYTLLETLLLLPPEVRPSGRSDGASHDVAFIRALNSRRGSQPFTKDALKYIDRQFETHYSEMLDEGGPRAAAHLSDLDAMWGEPVDLSDVNKFWPLLGTKPEEMPKATRMVRTIVESRAQELGVAEKDVCVTIAGAGRNASEVLIWLRAGAKVHVVEPEEGAIASLERSLTRMGMSEEEGGRLTSSNEKMGKNTLETSDIVVWNFPRNAFGLAAKDLSRSLKPGGLLIVQTDFPELYVNPFTTRDASKEFEPIFSRPLSRQNFLIPSGHLSLVSMADLAIFRRAMPESGTLSKSDAREPSRKWVEEAAPRPTLEAKAVVDRGVSRYEKEIGREYNVISNNIDFEGQDPQSLIDRASRKLADGSFTPDAYAHAARAYRGQLQHVIGKVRRAIYHTRSTTSVAKIFASATSGITLSPADAHSVLNTIVAAMRTRARAAAYVQLTQAKLDTQLMDAAENNKVMSGHEIDAARNRIITALLSEGSGKTISANAGRMALSEMDGILVIRPDNELVYQSIHSAYRDNRGVTEDSPEGFSTVTSNLGVAVVVVRPEHPGGRALLQREHQRQWSAQSPLADQEILAHLKSGTPLSQVLATPVAKRAGAAERVHLLYEAQDQLIARGYSPEAARHSLLDALTVVSFNDWLTEIPVIRDVLMREKEDGVVPMMAHARDHRPHLRQWVETSVLAMVNGHKNLDAFLETQDRQFAEARQRLHGRLDPDHLMDMRRKWCVGETQVEQMVDVLILLANEAHTHLDVLIHRAKTNPSLSLNAQIQKAEEACVVRDELLARVQAHVTPTQFHELQTDIEGRLRFKHAYFQNKVAEQPVQQQGAPDLVSKGVQESLPFDRDPVAPERKGMTMLAGAALMADVSSGVHQVLANVADTVFAHPYATTAAIVAGIAGVRLYTDHLTQMGRVRGAIKSMGIQKLIEDRSPDPKDPIISLNAFLRGELGREPTLAEVRQFEASTLEFKERREVYYLHQTAGGSPIYQIYTKEFLDALATRITTAAQAFRAKHGRDPVIMEVAAGDGRLSRSLRARGVAITATDVFDRGWGIKHADDVISEAWTSATERADIILGSWLPHDDIQKRQVLDVPIVQHVRTHPDKTYIQIESFVTNTGHFKQFVSGAEKLKTLAVDEPREFFELMTSRLGEETTHLRIYRGIPKEGARGISETYEEAVLLFSAHLMTEAREMTRTLLDTGKAMIDRGETVRLPHTKMEFDDYGKFAHRVQQMLALDNAEWRKIVTPRQVDVAPQLPGLPPPPKVELGMYIAPDVRPHIDGALKLFERHGPSAMAKVRSVAESVKRYGKIALMGPALFMMGTVGKPGAGRKMGAVDTAQTFTPEGDGLPPLKFSHVKDSAINSVYSALRRGGLEARQAHRYLHTIIDNAPSNTREIFNILPDVFIAMTDGGVTPSKARDSLIAVTKKNTALIFRYFLEALTSLTKSGLTPTEAHKYLRNINEMTSGVWSFNNLTEVLTVLTESGLTPPEARNYLLTIAEKSRKSTDWAIKHFPGALTALTEGGLAPIAARHFLTTIAEKAGVNTGRAIESLPRALTALTKSGLTPEAARHYLTTVAEKAGVDIGWAFEFLPSALTSLTEGGLTPEAARYYLTTIAEKAGGGTFESLPRALTALTKSGLTPEAARHYLTTIVEKAEGKADRAIRSLPSALTALTEIGLTPEMGCTTLIAIAEKSGANTGDTFINLPLGLLGIDATREYGYTDIAAHASVILRTYEIPETWVDALYADMQRRDVGIALFFQMLGSHRATPDRVNAAAANGPKALSRFLLADCVGLHAEPFSTTAYSEKSIGDFYESLLILQRGLHEPALKDIRWDDRLFQDRKLADAGRLIQSLNRLKGLYGVEAAEKWPAIVAKYLRRPITPENIRAIIQEVDDASLALFRNRFKIGDAPITMGQIQALEERWGNLESFFTLVARYAGNSSWSNEIPLLGKVAQATLNGQFLEAKYNGFKGDSEDVAAAKEQTAMLMTAEQQTGWRANYARTDIYRAGGAATAETPQALHAKSQEILQGQVLGHVREAVGTNATREDIDAIKAALYENPKTATINAHKANRPALTLALFEFLNEAADLKLYRERLILIRGNLGTLRLPQQIDSDLKSLDAATRYAEKVDEAIVFTTTTDDANLLMKVGDLVDTSSCQNYRTGSHIETLLGYVVDANVKVVLSYALKEKDFRTPKDYARAKELIASGVKPEFIAAKQQLKIGDMVVQLPKAYRRHIVKLGATSEGGAGIFLERDYSQNHPAEDMMVRQVTLVRDQLAKASGAVTDKSITMPASRNPGGVYSDAFGGAATGAYSITVTKPKVKPDLPPLPPPLAPADPVVNHMAIFPDVRGLYHAALKAYQRATQPTEKFVIGISGVGRPVTIKLPVAKSFDAADQVVARDAQRPILKKWVRDTIFTKDLESQPILEGTAISPDQEKVYQETRKILGQLENAMNAVARKYFDELRQPKSAELTEGQYPPPVNVAERAALYQKWCSETDAFLQIAAITEQLAKEAEYRVEDEGDKATPLTKSIATVRRYVANRIAETIQSSPWVDVDGRLTADRNAYIILAQAAIDVTDPGYVVPQDPSNLQRMTPQAAEAYAVELRAHFASPTTTEAMSSLIAFDKLVRSQKLSRRAIEAAAHDVADQLVNGTAPYGSKDHPLYFADRLLGLSVPTISMSPDELMAHWTREATEAFTRHLMDAIPMHTTPPADGEYGFDDARSHESKTKVTRVPKKILESGGAGGGVFMIAAMLPAWMEGGRELYKRAVQGFFDGGQKALSKKPESTLQTPATVARNGSEHYVVIPASTRDSPPAKMPGSDGVEYRWKRGALEIRDSRESVVGTTRITIDDGESSHVLPKGKWHVLRYGNKLTIGVKTFTVSQNFSVHVPAETALAADVRKNAPQLERLINSGVSPYDCLVLLSKFAKQSVQVGPDGHVYDNLEEHIPDNAVYRVNRSTSKFRKDVEALVGIIRRQFDRGETVTGARSHTKFPSRVEVEAFFAENRLSPESHAAAKRSYPFSDRVRDMVAQSPNQTPSNLLLGLIFENETTPDAMKADTLRTMAELRDYVVSEELTWGDALYNPETGTIMFKDDLDRFIDQKVGTPGYSQALVRVHDVQSRYTPEVAGDLWGSLESLIGDAPKRTPVDAFGFYLKDSATSKAFYKTTSYEVRLGIIRDAVMKRIRSGEIVRDMSGNQLKSAADFDRLVEQKLEQSLSIRKTQKIDVPVKPTPRPMPAVSEFLPKPLAQVSHDMRVHLRPFVDAFFNRQGASLKEATQELQMLEEGDSPTVSGPRKDRKFRTTGYTRYRNADTGATRVMDPAGADEQWRDNFIAGVQQLMPDGVSPEFPAPRDGNYFIPGMQGWYWGGAMMSEGDTPGKSPWDGRIFFAVDKGNDAASDIPKASILYAELSKMATAFKSRGTKVMFKIISGRSDRSDAAILYFKAGDEAAVYERMCQLSKLGVMRDRLPLFVAPLTDTNGTMLHGIGFAQHPSGQSFGARRARILNPIMDELDREAATGVRRGRVEVEGILAAALAAGGVDPEIPAFDAGGREKFPHIFHHMRFSREGEAPTIQGVDPDLRDLLDLLDSSTRNLPRKP